MRILLWPCALLCVSDFPQVIRLSRYHDEDTGNLKVGIRLDYSRKAGTRIMTESATECHENSTIKPYMLKNVQKSILKKFRVEFYEEALFIKINTSWWRCYNKVSSDKDFVKASNTEIFPKN